MKERDSSVFNFGEKARVYSNFCDKSEIKERKIRRKKKNKNRTNFFRFRTNEIFSGDLSLSSSIEPLSRALVKKKKRKMGRNNRKKYKAKGEGKNRKNMTRQ